MNRFFAFHITLLLLTMSGSFLSAQDHSARKAAYLGAPVNYDQLRYSHDLSLPAWGPYTKKYQGISHVPEQESGLRFDLSVFPGFYRQDVHIPNVLYPSGYHPWAASADLRFTEFRHELEWKDQVYSDISFSAIDDNWQLLRADCANNTDVPQNLVLHLMGYLAYPEVWPSQVQLPENGLWKDAIHYEELKFAKTRPRDDLPYDGWIRGEVRSDDFIGGSALGQNFGAEAGDRLSYLLTLEKALPQATIVLRYRLPEGSSVSFRSEGLQGGTISLQGGKGLQTKEIPLGALPTGEAKWTLTTTRPAANLVIDGFAVVNSSDVGALQFSKPERQYVPEILPGPIPNSLILKYAEIDDYYGLAWDYPDYEVREFFCADLDIFFRENLKDHVRSKLYGPGEGHYTNIFLRPIPMKAHSSLQVNGLVGSGSLEEVRRRLEGFANLDAAGTYFRARQSAVEFPVNEAGTPYRFSQERMAATLLMNVVYPVYTQNSYIKHNPPGRIWNSLYTWDSGFIGLGLAEFNFSRALECLNTYTNDPGEQAAFIHHGSPVPVQFYLFLELWNRTQSAELLSYFYPRLQRYHRFLAGREGSSSLDALGSGILKTWDYFYNSGGWDDYPPQVHVHEAQLEATVSPVINTAQAIRTAKIMKMMALALNKQADVAEYEADITRFSTAIQQHAWDDAAGYFGYVVHNDEGKPQGLLRTAEGVNYNQGMDGAYPLVAGICTPEQKRKLLEKLFTPGKMWTDIGLSVVDQSAPYYRGDGYWNGAVWMPHQWFAWKTMLDQGEMEKAWQIAHTGLEVWKNEVGASYHCFEHFLIETGRGAGWHQFGALSSPVLSWFGAYFIPGRITTGFDAWIGSQEFREDLSGVKAEISFLPNTSAESAHVIVTLKPGLSYQVRWQGQPIAHQEIQPGALGVRLPLQAARSGVLEVVQQ